MPARPGKITWWRWVGPCRTASGPLPRRRLTFGTIRLCANVHEESSAVLTSLTTGPGRFLGDAFYTKEPGRFFIALAVTGIGIGIFFSLVRRPRSERPVTWAQAMAAAMGVYALFLLGYGAVPHEWLTWADSSLGLREDKILIKTYPIDVSGRAVRDIVAVIIYVVFLGLNVAAWIMWQKRGHAKPKPAAAPAAVPA